MIESAAILLSVLVTAAVMALPRLRGMPAWRAMVTPLASIIGSGFLILGPILIVSFGTLAPLVMAVLCALAWGFGSAIRYSIGVLDEEGNARPAAEERLETLASAALGFAYVISVSYYLNLFGAFGLSLTRFNDPTSARLLTSAVFLAILAIGWTRGFRMLERLEYVSVSLKLAIIGGMLIGLAFYFTAQAQGGALASQSVHEGSLGAIAVTFGLIVTVQGFETARYLGAIYPAKTRIRAMRWAQILSTLIYLVYIGLTAFVFPAEHLILSETAIIGMMRVVAPVLPALLVAAALAAQFSAAVADTGGSGGLFVELTGKRISQRQAYAVLVGLGLVLTWSLDVFRIVSYASRAFAFYYGVQAAIAALSARRRGHRVRALIYGALALTGVAIMLFGRAVEGG